MNYKDEDKPYGDSQFRPGAEAIQIKGKRGKLFCLLYTAGGEGLHPTVLLLHGFPGTEQNMDLAQGIRRAGFNVMTMHYSGSWGSDGDFSFKNVLEDACTVCDFLENEDNQKQYRIDQNNLFIAGHSMGGFATLNTLAVRKNFKGGVALTPYDFGHAWVQSKVDEAVKKNLYDLLDEGTPWLFGTDPEKLKNELKQYGADYQIIRKAEELSKKPVYIIGGELDDCALIETHCVPIVRSVNEYNRNMMDYETMETDHCFSDLRLTMIGKVVTWLLGHIN